MDNNLCYCLHYLRILIIRKIEYVSIKSKEGIKDGDAILGLLLKGTSRTL